MIVDALLGTGFAGEPREPVAGAIAAIDAAGIPVVAADVPSGVDASTGEVASIAIRATATATFHAAKPGLWINPGKGHAGRVEVSEIGIPDGAPAVKDVDVGLIGDDVLTRVPVRGADATKFSAGAVLVIGGSVGLTGAPCLAAEGAARAGAGYVKALVPASLHEIFEAKLTEVMTVGLTDDAGALIEAALDAAIERAERADAVVLGPGLGRDPRSLALARALAAGLGVPIVLDADGLNAHAGGLGELTARQAPTVLTPHAGELARLLEVESADVGARRLHHAREAARRSGAVVVLKGDDTLVVEPGGGVAVSRGGAPALATAGSGDVLAGVIGALLAKGLGPFAAAAAGVHAHVRAGRAAADDLGSADGVVAGDLPPRLPAALAR